MLEANIFILMHVFMGTPLAVGMFQNSCNIIMLALIIESPLTIGDLKGT
jgi:hypothetical protein